SRYFSLLPSYLIISPVFCRRRHQARRPPRGRPATREHLGNAIMVPKAKAYWPTWKVKASTLVSSPAIRTAFVVCIRRGEITGAASTGKQPNLRTEDGTHPCSCFWNKPADLLFLRGPPRLLRQRRYQYPRYQTTRTWHSRDRGCNQLPQLRKGKHPLQVQ